MAYPNTKLDLTPGGEQFLNMLCDWETWSAFFDDFSDRLMYGTDFYAFSRSNEENWRSFVNLRPRFLRQFSETDTEHEYLGGTFRGVRFDPALREKLYMKNALVHYGDPKPIDLSYFAAECSRLEPLIADEDQKADLSYLKSALSL